jgi:SAM-dependent methyltransferase
MIRGARERLRGIANAHVHVGGGADLAGFDDGAFDLVYSYAVFQHIPSREAIFGYLAEAGRVLAPGGVLWFQANGAAGGGDVADTWHGARLAAGEAAAFAREAGLRLMAVEGPDTPYMAVTIQKPARGGARAAGPARIVRVAGGHHPGLAAPARGRRAFASLWIEGLPEGSDLNTLEATVQGARATGEWLGPFLGPPETDGIWQFRVRLPELEAGLDTVELLYRGARIAPAALLRTIPAGPAVPRLVALSDAAELLSTQRIASGAVRASFEEAPDAAGFRAQVDGRAITDCEARCVDPVAPRIEVTFRLPEGTGPGPHRLEMALGGRRFAALTIEVV